MKSQSVFDQNTANKIAERNPIIEIIVNSLRTLMLNTPNGNERVGLSHRTNQVFKFLGQFHILITFYSGIDEDYIIIGGGF